MLLYALEIKNYRSLEHIKLDNLQQFNVLIGRNNAGKSSVLLALAQLGFALKGQGMPGEVLTDRDASRSVEIILTFKPSNQEREEFIDLLIAAGFKGDHKSKIVHSPFFRMVQFSFRSVTGNTGVVHLRETKLLAQDGNWATIHQMIGEEQTSNPSHKFVNLSAASQNATTIITSQLLDAPNTGHHYSANLTIFQLATADPADPPRTWLYNRLYHYFSSAYYFNPFRHSEPILPVQLSFTLSQNGSNLAQVLHTLIANNRDTFDEIERFIHGALPDVGRLQTPLINNNQTHVVFRVPQGRYEIPLTDMGGGIEQLLMIATVLLTTNAENTIFVEEPESHMHAGAQRYLIEKLYSERQVFIATHSPTFITPTKPFSLYQVLHSAGRTQISHCDPESLEAVLEDIDVRNSDVLFSDAVLFVEGPGDRDVITTLSAKLGMNVAERNISVLPMGGGKHAERGAPIRSDLLNNISRKATVPHLFVLDRDERSNAEIQNLETQLPEQVHILQARELENYLLVPRAILAALKSKHHDDQTKLEQLATVTEDHIRQLINTAANNLYEVVLIKRIRTEIGGLREGLLPKESIPNLTPHTKKPELSALVLQEIKSRFESYVAGIKLDAIIETEKEALDKAWAIPENRLQVAPGEEILTVVFSKLGSVYCKPKDTARIAREMRPHEIGDEIKGLLEKVNALSPY